MRIFEKKFLQSIFRLANHLVAAEVANGKSHLPMAASRSPGKTDLGYGVNSLFSLSIRAWIGHVFVDIRNMTEYETVSRIRYPLSFFQQQRERGMETVKNQP